MITKYKIKLNCNNGKVKYNLGYQLYGSLMERLPENICEILHENGISPLAQNFVYNNRLKEYIWNICAFENELAKSIFDALMQDKTICLESEDISFAIEKIESEYIPSARELMKQSKALFNDAAQIEVKLLTPTAFKQDGSYVLYPTAQMMIGNLINKWNSLNKDIVIDDPYAVNEINNGLSISRYRLKSVNYNLKGVKVFGFVGDLTIKARLPAPLLEIVHLLFYFANYSGIGIKSTLGMGAALTSPQTHPGANVKLT